MDDEKSGREELSRQLLAFGTEHCRRPDPVPFHSAETFVEALRREHFPVVFMDIFLEGMDGLSAAAHLWEADKKCLLVCVCKHDGHGIGLISIAAVVEKYGGSVRFSNSDTEFFVDVVMKV